MYKHLACSNASETLRCDNIQYGRCFNITTINGTLASCNTTNPEFLQPIG